MTDSSRIRFLAILTLGVNVTTTATAAFHALDPSEAALWLSWGYLQKTACLLTLATFWPLLKISIATFIDTFPDEEDDEDDEPYTIPSLIQTELDRVTANPRVTSMTQVTK